MKTKSRKRWWLWLLPVLFLLWIVGAASDIRDAMLLEKEGTPIFARIEKPEWVAYRGTKALYFDGVWTHEGRQYRRNFKVQSPLGTLLVDLDGRQLVDEVELRYAPSRPQVAVVAALPQDPAWVSMIIVAFGITASCVVAGLLILHGKRTG